MKKNRLYLILTLLTFILLTNDVLTQSNYIRSGYVKSGYNRSNYHRKGNDKLFNVKARRIYFGVKGGLNIAYMEFSDPEINANHTSVAHFLPIAGLFVEFNIGNVISISPGVSYKADGGKLVSSLTNSPYTLSAHNLNINVPIYINMPMSRYANPYIFVAPEVQFNCFSGRITLEDDKVAINNGNLAYFNYGLKFGAGCIVWYEIDKSVCFIRIDCGYNFGFSNTFSEKELSGESVAVNLNNYHIKGTRFNRGIEICVSAGFPFNFK